MAGPLILARTFREAHAYATEELGLSNGYYRVVNSPGTIKAVRGLDIHLVPGWDKRPDRFTMKGALRYCRLNIIDVEKVRESQAAFDNEMPPAPEDATVHWVTPQFSMAHAVENVTAVKSSSDVSDVDCETCLDIIRIESLLEPEGWEPPETLTAEQVLRLAAGETGAEVAPMSEREPVAEMPEPAEAEESTPEPAPVDEAEPEIVVAEDNRQGPHGNATTVSLEEALEMQDPALADEPVEPPKRRRRTRCKDCGTLHFKGDPCPEGD